MKCYLSHSGYVIGKEDDSLWIIQDANGDMEVCPRDCQSNI